MYVTALVLREHLLRQELIMKGVCRLKDLYINQISLFLQQT